MMSKYVLTHQSNLVNLYALGCWVACDFLANSSPWGSLLIIIWKHILRAIVGQLIRSQHRNVPLMGNLAPPQIWHLTLTEKWHLTLSRYWHLALPRPWLAADASICLNPIIWACIVADAGICPNPTTGICISPICSSGNLSSCVSLSNPHGIGSVYGYGKYGA
jgi:hypothetical protein